ncbi:hypothetical protein QFZ52_002475 [Arthrobacter woluwensis]|uniref:hypothetical protein n=1 Tax=Arthrobacter woluwensis TaxID=156980 RepID=UPI00277F3493|nr:hypothetical protein [Arthrobacter woluwensis]MDQ0709823.1 hypothetical protein [Arthrobacter woluwensis]
MGKKIPCCSVLPSVYRRVRTGVVPPPTAADPSTAKWVPLPLTAIVWPSSAVALGTSGPTLGQVKSTSRGVPA